MRRRLALLACLALPTLARAEAPPAPAGLAQACAELGAAKPSGARAGYLERCLKGEDPQAIRLAECRDEAARRHPESRQEYLAECLKD